VAPRVGRFQSLPEASGNFHAEERVFFTVHFPGGYAASFCGNSASATNAAEDKEAGGRAKAAATRGAAEGRWSAERGGRSGGVQSLGSRSCGVAQGAAGAERRAGAREQVVKRGGVVARSGG